MRWLHLTPLLSALVVLGRVLQPCRDADCSPSSLCERAPGGRCDCRAGLGPNGLCVKPRKLGQLCYSSLQCSSEVAHGSCDTTVGRCVCRRHYRRRGGKCVPRGSTALTEQSKAGLASVGHQKHTPWHGVLLAMLVSAAVLLSGVTLAVVIALVARYRTENRARGRHREEVKMAPLLSGDRPPRYSMCMRPSAPPIIETPEPD